MDTYALIPAKSHNKATFLFFLGSSIAFFLCIASVFAREPYTIQDPSPANYDIIKTVVGDKTAINGEIFDYLNNAQCGGWNAGETVSGKIAVVTQTDPPVPHIGEDPNTRFCGDGNADFGENCGEPSLGTCTPPQKCVWCQCKDASIPPKPVPPPPSPPPVPPPPIATCGDGNIDGGESCGEPGLTCNPGYSCTNCQCWEKCGDGRKGPNEQCGEPGAPVCAATKSCVSCRCQAVCGDGLLDASEQCDIGSSCPDIGTYCNSGCRCVSVCGDGEIGPGEKCEEGPLGKIDTCDPAPCQGCQCMLIGDKVSNSFCELPGLPGREAKPFGNIRSGMGERNDDPDDFIYPYGAEGLSFANYQENPWCRDARAKYHEINKETWCSTVEGCKYECDWFNSFGWQYPVWRRHQCWAHMEGERPDGSTFTYWDTYFSDDTGNNPGESPVHAITQCHDCSKLVTQNATNVSPVLPCKCGAVKCRQIGTWPSPPEGPEYDSCTGIFDISGPDYYFGWGKGPIGRKYACTGDVDEWQDGVLRVPYGWVWTMTTDTDGDGDNDADPRPATDLPVQCQQYWYDEQTEYPNCTSCGREDAIPVFDIGKSDAGVILTPLNEKFEKSEDFAPGEECRCEGDGCRINTRTSPLNGVNYESFTRWYLGEYTRDAVPGVANDVTNADMCVGCYGWYKEFDTRTQATTREDWRCVIDISNKDKNNIGSSLIRDRQPKEKGKGDFGQFSNWPDIDPSEKSNQRYGGDPADRGELSQDKDLWIKRLGGGFSFINERVFDDLYDNDLSTVLGSPDAAEMKASYQLDETVPIAKYSLTRAFDDAVTNANGDRRPIVEWWQMVESSANILFSQPIVRLLLPAGWAVGIDPLDPLFAPNILDIRYAEEPRSEPIEVQLPAREDLVGEIVAYMERSLLFDIQEEPIAIIVPIGSPTEFRAIAESWCSWWKLKSNKDDCSGAPADIDKLIKKLEEYADRIEDVRNLRSELARYTGKVLDAQYNVFLPISRWLQTNLSVYQSFLSKGNDIFVQLKPWWDLSQKIYEEYHDRYSMPFCMNQRFTTPIYSLLDPAWPVRENGIVTGGRYCNTGESMGIPPICFPILHGIAPSQDFVFDLSMLSISNTSAISLPVIKPIQIKIDTNILAPPELSGSPNVPDLPDLPDISIIQGLIQSSVSALPTTVTVQSSPRIITPPSLNVSASISDLKGEMFEIATMLYMATCGTGGVSDVTGTGRGICNGEGLPEYMWPGIDDFWTSLTWNSALFCPRWSQSSCVQVEMDLLERFVRIGSRPAILLKEDLESQQGTPRKNPATCPPNDHACLNLLPERTFPSEGWQVIFPPFQSQDKNIQDLRESIREKTLPEPVGGVSVSSMFPYDLPVQDGKKNWQDLLPAVEVLEEPDISPYPDLAP